MAKKKSIANKTNVPARTWFLTIWDKNLDNMNIPKTFDEPETLESNFMDYCKSTLPENTKMYCALCKSKDDKIHMHVAVTFSKTKRLKSVADLFGKCHTEIMLGTKEQAKAYIEKTGSWEEKGEIILHKWGDAEAIENNSGVRTDLSQFDELCLTDSFNLNEFLLTKNNEKDIKMYTNRYYRLKREHNKGLRNIKVIYIEGESGSGKSYYAYNNYPGAFVASCDAKSSFPLDGYECQNILWLDELRPGFFNPAYLFKILDKYPFEVNVKGSRAPACWNTVIITSAVPLHEWYNNQNDYEYSDNLRKQFIRRITEHYICKHDKDGYHIENQEKLLKLNKELLHVV